MPRTPTSSPEEGRLAEVVPLRPRPRPRAPAPEPRPDDITSEHARPELYVENGRLVVRRSLTAPRRQTWLTVLP